MEDKSDARDGTATADATGRDDVAATPPPSPLSPRDAEFFRVAERCIGDDVVDRRRVLKLVEMVARLAAREAGKDEAAAGDAAASAGTASDGAEGVGTGATWFDALTQSMAAAAAGGGRDGGVSSLASFASGGSVGSGAGGAQWVQLLPFGSYALGASLHHSDVDSALLVAGVGRDALFARLAPLLRRSGATRVYLVRAARVPVLRFVLCGVHVDLVVVEVALAAPPSLADIRSISIFDEVSVETRPSINGVRTAQELLAAVGAGDSDAFRAVLKAVKQWAIVRGVYGNLFTYPGGVALAVMTARVCQAFPGAGPAVVFEAFFRYYTRLFGGRQAPLPPVFVTAAARPARAPRIVGMPETWDPRREPFSQDLLPVMNPAYPHTNTCYTVGRAGLRAFAEEVARADRALRAAAQASAVAAASGTTTPVAAGSPFGAAVADLLTRPYTPFDQDSPSLRPAAFVVVSVVPAVPGVTRRGVSEYSGFVESRWKLLLYALEEPGRSVHVRPWPRRLRGDALRKGPAGLVAAVRRSAARHARADAGGAGTAGASAAASAGSGGAAAVGPPGRNGSGSDSGSGSSDDGDSTGSSSGDDADPAAVAANPVGDNDDKNDNDNKNGDDDKNGGSSASSSSDDYDNEDTLNEGGGGVGWARRVRHGVSWCVALRATKRDAAGTGDDLLDDDVPRANATLRAAIDGAFRDFCDAIEAGAFPRGGMAAPCCRLVLGVGTDPAALWTVEEVCPDLAARGRNGANGGIVQDRKRPRDAANNGLSAEKERMRDKRHKALRKRERRRNGA